jgi:hypothetical protein
MSIPSPVDTTQQQMKNSVAQEEVPFERMKPFPPPLKNAIGVAEDSTVFFNVQPITVTWGPLLQKVERLTRIVDKISEVRHPAMLIQHFGQ